MLDFIKHVALEAGKIIREAYFKEQTHILHKGKIDLVTETDLQSEKLIKKLISDKFPQDTILAEESGLSLTTANRRWIIDPIDGTTNFAHRYPFCAVSIGVEEDNEIRYAIVYNPIMNELFTAEKGKGAYLNGEPIHISHTEEISNSLIATGFPYDRWEQGDFYIKEYLALMKKCQGVRRAGAAAIDLCYVACGRFDGFFERKLQPWDMAAGSLIVTEAGGKISQYCGDNWHYTDNTIIASNGKIHTDIVAALAQAHN